MNIPFPFAFAHCFWTYLKFTSHLNFVVIRVPPAVTTSTEFSFCWNWLLTCWTQLPPPPALGVYWAFSTPSVFDSKRFLVSFDERDTHIKGRTRKQTVVVFRWVESITFTWPQPNLSVLLLTIHSFIEMLHFSKLSRVRSNESTKKDVYTDSEDSSCSHICQNYFDKNSLLRAHHYQNASFTGISSVAVSSFRTGIHPRNEPTPTASKSAIYAADASQDVMNTEQHKCCTWAQWSVRTEHVTFYDATSCHETTLTFTDRGGAVT